MPRVLLVEDDAAVRQAIERALVRFGCRVTPAAAARDALAAIQDAAFDVVLTDVHMPEHDGLWLWRAATARRPELRGRFIFMSGSSTRQAIAERAPGERFLAKPFDLVRLDAEIRAVAQSVRRASCEGSEDSA